MTSTLSKMRPLEDRQVEHEVKVLEWSPKMDILAVGLYNGDVSLHRLNWQKIWTVSPPEECTCEALVWRPDGKVVAVGYSNGEIYLLDIESNIPVHVNDTGGHITCLSWIPCEGDINSDKEYNCTSEPPFKTSENNTGDDVWSFLTQLPSLSKAYSYNPSGVEDTEDCQRLYHGESISLLIAGTTEGHISLYMNGFLHCTKVDLNGSFGGPNNLAGINTKCLIRDVTVAKNMSTISVLCTENNGSREETIKDTDPAKLMIFSMPLVASCFEELSVLSAKFGVLEGMMNYMSDTLKQISEAWEEILLEMDIKLASYASKLPNNNHSGGSCGMAADFLELLTFGIPSPELEAFLLQELTEKGLKKLGHSIDVSYSNVQRLVLKYLHTVSQSLNFHLAEMMGQVKASDKYGMILGVTEENIVNAQQKAASFWNKGIELQQVIDESMKSFKAFFRWLYVEILRLSDEDVSEELSKVSQQDISFIAEFLDSFASETYDDEQNEYEYYSDNKENNQEIKIANSHQSNHHKSLERVGQYLKDESLKQPVDRSNNPWYKFLNENPEFKEVPFIIQVNERSSLIQEFNKLNTSVRSIFSCMSCDMTEKCNLVGDIRLLTTNQNVGSNLKLRQFSCVNSDESIKIFGCIGNLCSNEYDNKLLVYELTCPSKPVKRIDGENSKKHSLKGLWLSFEKFSSDNDPEVSINTKHLKAVGKYNLVDCRFYTGDTISILLNESYVTSANGETSMTRHGTDQNQRMIQLAISDAEIYFREIKVSAFCHSIICKPNTLQEEAAGLIVKSIFDVTGQACHRELEKIASVQFAVSGPRKVAAFLFENKKRVRIYDMEVEEASDDEDDEENEIMGGQSSGLSSSELNTSH